MLKRLFGTPAGAGFYTDYKQMAEHPLFQYLHPFKASKKKVSNKSE